MSDTPTTPAEATAEPTPVEAKKERKERYSGEIDLDGFENSAVDLKEVRQAGRPPEIDYAPYLRLVEQNYNQNKDRPENDKVASGKTWKKEAVTTVKSRFGVAATRLNVGLNWVEKDVGNGFVQLDFIAGERTLRPRKAKEDGTQEASQESNPETTGEPETVGVPTAAETEPTS